MPSGARGDENEGSRLQDAMELSSNCSEVAAGASSASGQLQGPMTEANGPSTGGPKECSLVVANCGIPEANGTYHGESNGDSDIQPLCNESSSFSSLSLLSLGQDYQRLPCLLQDWPVEEAAEHHLCPTPHDKW